MYEVTSITTRTYDAGEGFYVDIVTDNQRMEYGAWVYHESCGDKDFMFGVPFSQNSYEDFYNMVCRNLDMYVDDYKFWKMEVDYD